MHKKTVSITIGNFVFRSLSIAALTAGLVATPMLAQAQTTGHSHMSAGDAAQDMHGSMMAMQQQMDSVKSSGDIDYDFAVMMRIHHQGAVDMARMELEKGKDAQMKALAKDIIAAQEKEIAQFDQWIAGHKKPQR